MQWLMRCSSSSSSRLMEMLQTCPAFIPSVMATGVTAMTSFCSVQVTHLQSPPPPLLHHLLLPFIEDSHQRVAAAAAATFCG